MDIVPFAEHEALSRLTVRRWREGRESEGLDHVAAEVPVALEYNGIAHVVMLASPTDVEDFAVGFSLSEGIVERVEDIFEIETETSAAGIQVKLRIEGGRFAQLKERRRNLAGRTGCGLCGSERLDQVFRALPPVASPFRLGGAALHAALEELREHQCLQGLTGATHAAAWIDGQGRIVMSREDVGRHNALDKLIGALARGRADFASGAAIITSRASYEMVQKAAAVGIGLVAAVSAPTALAVDMAERLNVTLVGFVRPGNHVVYAHGERLPADPQGERP